MYSDKIEDMSYAFLPAIETRPLFWPSSSECGIHLAIQLTHIFFFQIVYVDPVHMHKHLAT